LTKVTQVQGSAVTIESCEEFTSGRGLRNIQTPADSPFTINQLVLRSTRAKDASLSITTPTSNTRTNRTTSINSCTSGCWLELNDGWNIGWEGSLADQTLADPVASAGGRLLWNLPATPDNTKFETNWTPQKRMWIGIGVTLFGLLCALVVLAFPLLRRRTLRADPQTMTQPVLIHSAITVITSAAIVGALVISPLYGLFAGLVTAAALRSRSIHKAGLVLVTLGMLFLIAQQIRTGAVPSFGWPSVFRRSHQPILLGLVLITIDSWSATRCKSDKPVISTASISEL
jgi:hypothetical protein